MRTIQLQIPDSVDLKDYDFLMIIASKLYEDGRNASRHKPREVHRAAHDRRGVLDGCASGRKREPDGGNGNMQNFAEVHL